MSEERNWVNPSEVKSIKFIKAKDLAENPENFGKPVVEGILVERLPNKFKDGAFDYKFELENDGVVVINHTGSLAFALKNVSLGEYVRVIYEGMEPIKSGAMKGKPAHQFTAVVDRAC